MINHLLPDSIFSKPTWQRLAILAGILTLLLSFIGFSGWLFNIFSLRSFLSDGTTMKVNTALILLAGGGALLSLSFEKLTVGKALIAVMALIALLSLTEYIFKTDLKIDELFFQDMDTDPNIEPPGRPSIFTLINAVLLASSLWLATLKHYRYSQAIAVVAFLLIYGTLLGHIFGVSSFYRLGKFSGIAFHTTLSFLLLIFGCLFYQASHGWVTLFFRKYQGRNIITYLVSFLMTVVPMLIALYLYLIRVDELSPVTAILWMALIVVLICIPLVYIVLNQLSRMDSRMTLSAQRLEIALDAAQLGSYDLDLATGKMVCTARLKANFGLAPDAVFDFPDLLKAIRLEDREQVQRLIDDAVKNKTIYHAEYKIVWPNGEQRWISAHGIPQYDDKDKPVSVIGITYDITQQKESEQRKNDFIGMVSHELKTPLTSLTAIIQLMNAKAKGSEDTFISGGLQKAEVQVKKMGTMISGFLSVAKLESGHILLKPSEFDLSQLIWEIAEESRLIYPKHQFLFESGEGLVVQADRDKIGQVLQNLLTNAVKYSPGSYEIQIHCEQREDKAYISVRDHGMGIQKEDQSKLFDRFYRVNDTLVNPIQGFGIGLYLCAEIIKLHDGRIWVNSDPQEGADFQFTIPLR